ncbi:unnamed protein product, partial [Iphiclides podalirius]
MNRGAIPERAGLISSQSPPPPPPPSTPATPPPPSRQRQKKNANTPPRKLLVILAPLKPATIMDLLPFNGDPIRPADAPAEMRSSDLLPPAPLPPTPGPTSPASNEGHANYAHCNNRDPFRNHALTPPACPSAALRKHPALSVHLPLDKEVRAEKL